MRANLPSSKSWIGPIDSTTLARSPLTARPRELLELMQHPDFSRAVPTPDHFYPLAMTSYTLDTDCPPDLFARLKHDERGAVPRITMLGQNARGAHEPGHVHV